VEEALQLAAQLELLVVKMGWNRMRRMTCLVSQLDEQLGHQPGVVGIGELATRLIHVEIDMCI
jgi:hypothetical protein